MPFPQPTESQKEKNSEKQRCIFLYVCLLWNTSYSFQKDNYRTKQSSEQSYWDDEVWKHYYMKVKELQLFSVEKRQMVLK